MSSAKKPRTIEGVTGFTAEQLRAMSAEGVPTFDEDNPELTAEDWAQMRPASELPPEILAAFPKTKLRGPQKAPTKVAVSLRLSRDVVDYYRASGEGWQTRIDEALREAIRRAG